MDDTRGLTHLALGNSLMAAGFDSSAFDQYLGSPNAVAFNAGLGSSYPVEHLILLRRALRDHSTINTVIYGFFDLQLTDNSAVTTSDLVGNRAASYYLEPDIALEYYRMSPRDRLAFELLRHVPMFVDRAAIWARVEQARRAMAQIGLPVVATNRFGQVSDFALLEARSSANFNGQCERALRETPELSAPVRQIIRQSQARGARVVIVEMPMSEYHRRTFYSVPGWVQYRDHVRALVEANGATYVAASDWIADPSEFADHLHLAPSGAQDFSRKLAVYCRTNKNARLASQRAPNRRGCRQGVPPFGCPPDSCANTPAIRAWASSWIRLRCSAPRKLSA